MPREEGAEGTGALTRSLMGEIGRFVPVAKNDASKTDAVDVKGGGSRDSEAHDRLGREVCGTATGGSASSGLEEADAAENFSPMICRVLKTSAGWGKRAGAERLGNARVWGA